MDLFDVATIAGVLLCLWTFVPRRFTRMVERAMGEVLTTGVHASGNSSASHCAHCAASACRSRTSWSLAACRKPITSSRSARAPRVKLFTPPCGTVELIAQRNMSRWSVKVEAPPRTILHSQKKNCAR